MRLITLPVLSFVFPIVATALPFVQYGNLYLPDCHSSKRFCLKPCANDTGSGYVSKPLKSLRVDVEETDGWPISLVLTMETCENIYSLVVSLKGSFVTLLGNEMPLSMSTDFCDEGDHNNGGSALQHPCPLQAKKNYTYQFPGNVERTEAYYQFAKQAHVTGTFKDGNDQEIACLQGTAGL
eukprot:m.115837 g.115837  ORF g.115837 m.115837 type:complete len:181 (+) comp37568_c0_seq1:87-629(+)